MERMNLNTYNFVDARADKTLEIKWGDFYIQDGWRNEVTDLTWRYNHVTLFDGNDRMAKHLNKPREYGLFQIETFGIRILVDKIEVVEERNNEKLKAAAKAMASDMFAIALASIANVIKEEKSTEKFDAWLRALKAEHERRGANSKAYEIRMALQIGEDDDDNLKVYKE